MHCTCQLELVLSLRCFVPWLVESSGSVSSLVLFGSSKDTGKHVPSKAVLAAQVLRACMDSVNNFCAFV